MSYVDRLTEINLAVIGQFTSSNKHHDLQCLVCNHIWSATPMSKVKAFKDKGHNGCPNCSKNRQHSAQREEVLKQLEANGIECVSAEFKGQQTAEKFMFKNTACNHTFESTVTNVLYRHVKCPVCN